MNIKLASTMLFCSVVLSCSISEGQLLDRMLSRVGCSACQTVSACDTGCDSGCGGQIVTGNYGMVDSCGCNKGPGILDKIKDRLAQVGCGSGCGAVAPSPCGCVEPVVEPCGCDVAPTCGGGGFGFLDKLKGRLSSMGNGCGCAAPAADCGCEVAPVVATPCGCNSPAPACGRVGLLDNLKVRFSSMGGCAAPRGDCGCDIAPVVTPCPAPCNAAPACGCGLFDRLKGRMSSNGGGCGCAAPVANDCGCAAPAAAPCGCDAAPACGCESACGATSGRVSLLDRLRGKRNASDCCGNGCNDACSPCGGGQVIYGAPAATMQSEGSIMETPPVITTEPAAEAGGGIIEAPAAEGVGTPAVDPNAFIIRNHRNIRG